jgi:hypothetical protein
MRCSLDHLQRAVIGQDSKIRRFGALVCEALGRVVRKAGPGEPRLYDHDRAFARAKELPLKGIAAMADMGTVLADRDACRRTGESRGLNIWINASAKSFATPERMARGRTNRLA